MQTVSEDLASGQELAAGEGGGPLADIHFEYNLGTLSDEARATLSRHAQWLQQHPEARVTIEGHCDERGTVEYNLALGDLRAQSTRDYLVSLGIAADRLAARLLRQGAAARRLGERGRLRQEPTRALRGEPLTSDPDWRGALAV